MRDAQKGRKSWLERLTSPPETDDEAPGGSGERSPFDQPSPFDQRGPFDPPGMDQGPPVPVPPGQRNDNRPGREGFDAFAPPALRKPGSDDAKPEGSDRPQDLPAPSPMSLDQQRPRPGDEPRNDHRSVVSSDRALGRTFGDEPGPQPPGALSGSNPPREPWEIPVTNPIGGAQAGSPRPPAAGDQDSADTNRDSGPIPVPASEERSGSLPGSLPTSSNTDNDDEDDNDSADSTLSSAGSSSSSPWQSESEDTNDMPSLGESTRLSHKSRDDDSSDKLPDEVVPMPVGPSEEEQLEAARKRHVEELQHRWLVTQAQLLDDPRDAVREAGLLIGDAMQFVTSTFTDHRDRIEREWKNESELSTDELRTIMRRYRNLFQYVLSASQLPDL